MQRAGGAGDPRDGGARLLADLGDPRQTARGILERGASVRDARSRSGDQGEPGRIDHGAGVSIRRHLDVRGSAVDDDHAPQPGRPRPGFQDRQNVHPHTLRPDTSAVNTSHSHGGAEGTETFTEIIILYRMISVLVSVSSVPLWLCT